MIPGLQDHHCHLLSAAVAADSVLYGPPAVRARTGLRKALSKPAGPDGWHRGIGYDKSVAGDIDRWVLDQIAPAVPTRVQHRSGALWVLNSVGLATLGIEDQPGDTHPDGVERDAAGRLTGRLWRVDGWLRDRLPIDPSALRYYGCHRRDPGSRRRGDRAAHRGWAPAAALPARRAETGDRRADGTVQDRRHDHALPGWDELAARVSAVGPRPVAVHSVSRESLILILAVLREGGLRAG